jgi:hypothetical protein
MLHWLRYKIGGLKCGVPREWKQKKGLKPQTWDSGTETWERELSSVSKSCSCRPSTACTLVHFLVVHRMLRSSDVNHLTSQQQRSELGNIVWRVLSITAPKIIFLKSNVKWCPTSTTSITLICTIFEMVPQIYVRTPKKQIEKKRKSFH